MPKCKSCQECIAVTTGKACCSNNYIYIYSAHLASVKFEQSLYHGSLMTTYVTLLDWLVKHSLVHWYQQSETVHHVPKCVKCHKDIVMIIWAQCFHDYKNITFVRLEHSLRRG